MKSIKFIKLHGCGNDFFVFSDKNQLSIDNLRQLAINSCNRHYGISGIGADGMLVVKINGDDLKKNHEIKKFKVIMLNPDGTDMGMCGNGIRCVVRFLVLNRYLTEQDKEVHFNVEGRQIICFPLGAGNDFGKIVTVNMGVPDISMCKEKHIENHKTYRVDLGNPHCIIFENNINQLNLSDLGPKIESHFPDGMNVSFVEIIDQDKINVRTWERGAGITLACGTGAVASVVAGICNNLLNSTANSTVTVTVKGGSLSVKWDKNENQGCAYLTGPAQEIFSGEYK